MSDSSKNILFGQEAASNSLRNSLDSLSSTLKIMKQQHYIKSGFAKGVQEGAHGVGAGAVGALVFEHFSTLVEHLLQGNIGHAAGLVAGAGAGLATAPILSKVLTSPTVMKWFAKATKAPKTLPILLTELKMNHDQESKDLYTYLTSGDKQ